MDKISVKIDDRTYEIELIGHPLYDSDLTVVVDGEKLTVTIPDRDAAGDQLDWIVVGNRPYEIFFDPDLRWVKVRNRLHRLEVRDASARFVRPVSADGRVKAPIPGLVRRVMVKPGDRVEAGQALLVLEAMKMENEICATRSGTVQAVNVTLGQGVSLHEILAEIS